MRAVRVIDSHTEGEPTRVVVEGAPDLGSGSMAERLERFRSEHDEFRSAVVNEPRGSDVMVGALLLPPVDPSCAAGVIFFNNVGYLGMCGHGSMGIVATLAHLGRIGAGPQRIETPVGVVTVELNADGSVTVDNVPSYRSIRQLSIDVEGHGPMTGDVAWGGNWFFLTEDHGEELTLRNTARLTDLCWRVRSALERAGITGADGHEIDHVELTGPPSGPMRTAEISCCVRAARTIAHPAAPAHQRGWRVWPPMASWAKERFGGRRASSAACSRDVIAGRATASGHRSPATRTSMPRRRCCSIRAIHSAWAFADEWDRRWRTRRCCWLRLHRQRHALQ